MSRYIIVLSSNLNRECLTPSFLINSWKVLRRTEELETFLDPLFGEAAAQKDGVRWVQVSFTWSLLLETKDIDLIKNLATLTWPSFQVGDSREPGGEAEEQPGAAAEVGEDEELPGRGQVMANNDDDRQGQRQTW